MSIYKTFVDLATAVHYKLVLDGFVFVGTPSVTDLFFNCMVVKKHQVLPSQRLIHLDIIKSSPYLMGEFLRNGFADALTEYNDDATR